MISSLTIQLSKGGRSIKFRFGNRETYAKTSQNETLFDMHINVLAGGFVSRCVSTQEIKEIIADSLKKRSKFEPRAGSLFYSGLKEEDRLKKFLYLFQSLEIYTHKTFAQINFDKHIDKVNLPLVRLQNTARKYFVERQAENKNLNQRFMWCAILIWESLEDSDVEDFKKIKKARDKILHGEELPEKNLPMGDLENLLFKIFNYAPEK